MNVATPLPSDAVRDRRQRRMLVGLALLFFAPIGLSFYLYYGHSAFEPGRRVNFGELVQPPRPLPAVPLTLADGHATHGDVFMHKWTLLYVGPGSCDTRCRAALYDTRQVRLALDRDMDRVQRVFVAAAPCCDEGFLRDTHPDLVTVRDDAAAAPLIAELSAPNSTSADTAGRVYVIDPLGNLMMYYPPDAKPKGMLEDLKRLLRLSHIG
jgi:cytochrome oxidase Cu insertion factor (SCO1/SenC/PrrC family)